MTTAHITTENIYPFCYRVINARYNKKYPDKTGLTFLERHEKWIGVATAYRNDLMAEGADQTAAIVDEIILLNNNWADEAITLFGPNRSKRSKRIKEAA